MSNRLYIEPTEFKSVRSGGGVTKGVLVHDSYESIYDNNWDVIPDNDLEVLKKCLEGDTRSIIVDYLSSLDDNCKSIYIGDEEYTWDQIKDYF